MQFPLCAGPYNSHRHQSCYVSAWKLLPSQTSPAPSSKWDARNELIQWWSRGCVVNSHYIQLLLSAIWYFDEGGLKLTAVVVKQQLRYQKTRYRGLRKQTAKLNMLFALANLILADRPCLAAWISALCGQKYGAILLLFTKWLSNNVYFSICAVLPLLYHSFLCISTK